MRAFGISMQPYCVFAQEIWQLLHRWGYDAWCVRTIVGPEESNFHMGRIHERDLDDSAILLSDNLINPTQFQNVFMGLSLMG